MLKLNDRQQQAVDTTQGAVLVLAGAGSGKTRVLTNRVANLVQSQLAKPWEILAITFTNKAAAEMRERIEKEVDFDIKDMWISTFHAMCVRMLRRYADKLGYTSQFLIYDVIDTQRVIKNIIKEMGLSDSKMFNEKLIKNIISKFKNDEQGLTFEGYVSELNPMISDYAQDIYSEYQRTLKQQNAMDFDDLLLNTLKLLETDQEAREYYQNKFKYILVDEYQDTNMVQYSLVKILSEGYNNLFVVGDDDQSIYAFRGANIRNILEFEKDFPGAIVIRLEQNYRSDKRILDLANCIIKNNKGRKGKTLFSDIETGEKPLIYTAQTESDEAMRIAQDIQRLTQLEVDKKDHKDIAILYRMHTLSRELEEKLRMYAIPYRVFGGTAFYDRKEIKDIVAYLNIISNPAADLHLLRIINVPKRGIGDAKVAMLQSLATQNDIPILEVLKNADTLIADKALKKKAIEFYSLYTELADDHENMPAHEIIENVFEKSGYKQMLEEEGTPEAQMRAENVAELINSAYKKAESDEELLFADFLQNITLISELDSLDEKGGVTLMTMHAAKGLEYDVVYLVGMDENIFPSQRAIEEDALEEERRLLYVAITRARKRLMLLNCQVRQIYGRQQPSLPSRFIEEIDTKLIEDISPVVRMTSAKAAEKQVLFTGGMQWKKAKPKSVSSEFAEGMSVSHQTFGEGVIKSVAGEGDSRVATVKFANVGEKKMFLAFASLEILEK